jgi:predicted nucleic acid-binding protein
VAQLTHLLDMSVAARLGQREVAEVVEPLQRGGRVGRTGVLELEAMFAARSHADAQRVHEWLLMTLPLVPTHQADWERASEVMLLLAERGKHRAAGLADLVLAAVGERAGLTVLHCDRHFQHIAEVTGQPVQVVAPGS